MSLVLMFMFGICIGIGICLLLRARPEPEPTGDSHRALIVSFLGYAGEPQTQSDISWGMLDFTRGKHDWVLYPDDKLYSILDSMTQEGILLEGRDILGYRSYTLRAGANKVMEIK